MRKQRWCLIATNIYTESEFLKIVRVNIKCTEDARLSMNAFWRKKIFTLNL